jgi:hypothetical protein
MVLDLRKRSFATENEACVVLGPPVRNAGDRGGAERISADLRPSPAHRTLHITPGDRQRQPKRVNWTLEASADSALCALRESNRSGNMCSARYTCPSRAEILPKTGSVVPVASQEGEFECSDRSDDCSLPRRSLELAASYPLLRLPRMFMASRRYCSAASYPRMPARTRPTRLRRRQRTEARLQD